MTRGRIIVLVAVVAGGAVTATAVAVPDSSGVIHGCYSKGNGQLRVVDRASDCRTREQLLTWNQRGPAGPQGLPGAKGNTGAQGPAGTTGAQGPVGPQGPAASSGLLSTQRPTATSPAGETNNGHGATATCPTGTKLLSGGYRLTGLPPAHIAHDDNGPVDGAEAWHAFARNEFVENGSGWGITVTALCAKTG
jgi:hypothetical protein